MSDRTIEIVNPTGLHTRPATRFVREARSFSSQITIEKAERRADAKNLVKVLKIGISKGDRITISAEGPDAELAVDHLCGFISALED